MQKTHLHFCTDQTAWLHILPSLLSVPVVRFDWDGCQTPQDYRPIAHLLKQSSFCPIAINPRTEQAIADWLSLYGPNLRSSIHFTCWGDPFLEMEHYPLPLLSAAINGYVLDIQSRHPDNSLRSLLLSRGLLHPVQRKKISAILTNCADFLGLEVQPFAAPPAFGF